MNSNAKLIKELIYSVEWEMQQQIRLFWVKIKDQPRNDISRELFELNGDSVILPIVLREPLFISANAILSDFVKLIETNRAEFERVKLNPDGKLTIVLLLKDDFKLSQVSSPVNLPKWFPILGGLEIFLKISNLIQTAEVSLLHCPEARIETLAELLYEMESLIVQRLQYVSTINPGKVRSLIDILITENAKNANSVISSFEDFLRSITDPKSYRVNSSKKNSLVSLFLNKFIKSSPDQLASFANKVSDILCDESEQILKPTLFSIMFRPSNKVSVLTRNWHAILISCYQIYQLTNAAAHAGEYPTYPVNLIYSNSYDLVRFLNDTNLYLISMNE
ncbi:hypothetical protein L1C56_25285 [Klebsiella pneumoniae]|uniref:hypothetical protein n=1 Tax=Klebsiella pneumoniae complex TaxID=3390273 RepID=UPI0013304859|nr:hypothetical protein [Klebsiella pneumoniae]HDT4054596.1 hypothetical protein [Klebsiella pneumoniae subsp. pneumoniae]MBC4367639.1 hypothetical protein [Klebsiella pneumoniae]MCB3281152.1 hypothetical protein [Klebsiella pneumoniae]MCF0568729.1 hypothetical protein [Klebsiella pneumoniae]MCF0656220.1 hypothetical protein [Klebsiella pneumoniae]